MSKQIKQPKIHSVKYNVVMNAILTTSTFLFPLITVPYVSRVLGPDNNGIVSWAYTFVGYFSLVAQLGFTMYGTRECAKLRDDRAALSKTVQELLIILFASTAIVYVVYVACLFFIPRTREQLPLMFIAGLSIWLTSCSAEWLYRAIEQYSYITVRNIVFKVLSIILLFIFVRRTNDILAYAAVLLVGTLGSNILNLLRLRAYVTFSRHHAMNIRRHFKAMFTFSVSNIASGMYGQIDMLLLGFLASNYALGLYQLVYKIRNMCNSAVGAVSGVMLPRLSYYEAQKGHEATTKLMAKSFNFLVMLGLALMAAVVICAQPIILLLGGRDYLPGWSTLVISSPMILLGPIGSMQSQYMVAANREKEYTYTTVTGLVLAIIFELIFIPLWGINGAAFGLVVTEICVYALRTYIIRDFIKEVHKHTDYWKIIISWIAGCAGAVAISWLCQSWSPIPRILLAAVGFCAFDAILLILTKESFLQSMLHRKK